MEGTKDKSDLFGVSTTNITNRKLDKFTFLKSLLRIQSFKFWLIAYLLSFIVYYFAEYHVEVYTEHINLTLMEFSPFILLLNFILFPFSIILLGKIGSKMIQLPKFIYVLFFPTVKISKYINSPVLIFFLFVLKLVLFYLLWTYSYIVGIIGLILMLIDAKNLSK